MSYYFDHNSSTFVDPRVLERFLLIEERHHANSHSLHGAGRQARAVIEQAREEIGGSLDLDPKGVIFLSGGTEANNLAIQGSGDQQLPVLLAPTEHPSVFDACAERGRVLWDVDGGGAAKIVAPNQPVGLICLVHGQNEVGTLQAIEEAAQLADQLRVPMHTDASQSLGRVRLRSAIQVSTSITLSGHKAGGLRGSGVLIARDRQAIRPMLHGGAQEGGARPGTQSPGLIAATALAIRLAVEEQPARAAAMRSAREAFLASLAKTPEVSQLTPENSLPNTLMLGFTGIEGRSLLPALDLAGVEASQGSACAAGSPSPPQILAAMGLSDEDARCCVRFSFSHRTSAEEAGDGGLLVAKVVAHLRGSNTQRSFFGKGPA